jgi:hypothetical protein
MRSKNGTDITHCEAIWDRFAWLRAARTTPESANEAFTSVRQSFSRWRRWTPNQYGDVANFTASGD